MFEARAESVQSVETAFSKSASRKKPKPPSEMKSPEAECDLERLPSVADPYWEEVSADLLEYLSTPRTVAQLYIWGADKEMGKDVLRNSLAWLSINGHAEPYREGKVVLWRQRVEVEEDPPLPEDHVAHGTSDESSSSDEDLLTEMDY